MSIPEKYKNNIFYQTFHRARLLYFRICVWFQLKTRVFIQLLKRITKIIHSPKKILLATKILLTEGPSSLVNKIKSHDYTTDINAQYKKWFKKKWPKADTLKKQEEAQKNFHYRPLISIITPVYNPDEKWLRSCIESVLKQSYNNWELCIADDCSTKDHVKKVLNEYSNKDKRIKVVFRSENGHISRASNSALKIANGEFIALLDHDDDLSPQALYRIVEVLNINKNLDLIYSDEDKVELNGQHVDPFFKPDWSPDMLLSTNYICHFSVIRKSIIDKVDGFRVGYEGSQDYDLFLRVTEITKNILHIPEILYSWRKIPNSTATSYSIKNYANQASINALQDHLDRLKIKAIAQNGLVEGTFRIKYKIIGNPLISIIIPTKDKIKYLKRCVDSILKKTTYYNYEILITDTGSIEKETLKHYNSLRKYRNIKFLKWNKTFNYSSVNNYAVSKSRGKYLILLNNDTEVITPGWIEAMLEHAQRKEVGAVGAKLLYPNNLIQHAGVILGIKGGNIKRGVAGHILKMFPDVPLKNPMLNSKDIIRNYSAVTAACLMISKDKYLKVKGLDEKFRIAFNDVDFNLRLTTKGYLNIYTPYAKLFHHESISVGTPQNGNRNLKEFSKEICLMLSKWDKLLDNDPFYNRNLSSENEDYAINTN